MGDRTINAIFENGTMRDEQNKASTALNTSEYIKPGTHFLDIVTFKDVTADELRYALGNLLLTTRYGAVSSRVGRMDNQILGVFGGMVELPSSLELVQGVYDRLSQGETPLEHPLDSKMLTEATEAILNTWTEKRGISMKLSPDELNDLIEDVDRHWSLEEQANFLKRLDESYEPYRQIKAKAKADNTKGRKTKS